MAGKIQFQRVDTNVYTFEEPGRFVTEGLDRISRNPRYLGLVLAGYGAALISATLAALVLVVVFAVTRGTLAGEEANWNAYLRAARHEPVRSFRARIRFPDPGWRSGMKIQMFTDLRCEPGGTVPRHRTGADVIVLTGGHAPCTVDPVDFLGEHRLATWK